MRPQHEVLRALGNNGVRHLLVGIAGANCWARDGSLVASHDAHEILVDPVPAQLETAWRTLRSSGFTLREETRRIPDPIPERLASDVVDRLASTNAYRMRDRTLVELHTRIPGFTFEELWREHRDFRAGEVELHVARLRHILASLHARDARFDGLLVATWSQGMHDLFVPDPAIARILAEHRRRHGIVRAGDGDAALGRAGDAIRPAG
jgi:hypothetical protein